MRIYNDTALQIAPLPWQLEPPSFALSVIVKGTFTLRHDEVAVLSDESDPITGDVFSGDAFASTCRYASDFVPHKPHADLMLVGNAYAPRGKTVTQRDVTFAVGRRQSTLRVTGDRYWLDKDARIASQPLPFDHMPLVYERAFGGPGFAANPVGKGVFEPHAQAPEKCPLPNIEDPSSLDTDPTTPRPAAGFAPLASTWAHRAQKLGTYDARWLATRWPWYPADFDPTHFNAAQPAMQENGYLTGDEEVLCVGLHREHERFRARLPGVRPRAFVNGDTFREVTLALDTLWVDAESDKLVLCWRGHVPVRSETYDEIRHLYVTRESLDARRALADEHEQRFLATLAAEEPVPEIATAAPPANDNEPAPPPADAAPDQKLVDEMISVLEAANTPPALIDRIRAGEDPMVVLGVNDLTPEQRAKMRELEEQADAYMRAALVENGHDPTLLDREPKTSEPVVAPWSRERVVLCVDIGESMAGADLSGLDLSELELVGVDLAGAILAEANLQRARLREAKLSGAVLAGADLRGALLFQADLRDADLRGVNAALADLSQCVLEGAVLDSADLTGAKLVEAKARGASLLEAVLEGASAEQADFDGARLSRSRLTGATFAGASLRGADLEGAVADDTNFTGANIEGMRASVGTSLERALLVNARGDGSQWMDAKLAGADLSLASFVRADFRGADLTGAKLTGCNLRQTDLCFSVLRNARATRANLEKAILYEAELWRADLEGAVLDGAHLAMTKLAQNEAP